MKRPHLHPPAVPTPAWPLAAALLLAACNQPGAWVSGESTALSTLSLPGAQFADAGLELVDVAVFRLDTGQRVAGLSLDVSTITAGETRVSLSVPAEVPLAFRANAGTSDRYLDYYGVQALAARTRTILSAGRTTPVELVLGYPYAGMVYAPPGSFRGTPSVFAMGPTIDLFGGTPVAMGAEFFWYGGEPTSEDGGITPMANGSPPQWVAWADFPADEYYEDNYGAWIGAYAVPDTCPTGENCDVAISGPLTDDLGWTYDGVCYYEGCWDSFLNGVESSRYALQQTRGSGRLRVDLVPAGVLSEEFWPEVTFLVYRNSSGRQIGGWGEFSGGSAFDGTTGAFTFEVPDLGPGTLQAVVVFQDYTIEYRDYLTQFLEDEVR